MAYPNPIKNGNTFSQNTEIFTWWKAAIIAEDIKEGFDSSFWTSVGQYFPSFPFTRTTFYTWVANYWALSTIYSEPQPVSGWDTDQVNTWAKIKCFELALFGSVGNGADTTATTLSKFSANNQGRYGINAWTDNSLNYLRHALIRFYDYGACFIDPPEKVSGVNNGDTFTLEKSTDVVAEAILAWTGSSSTEACAQGNVEWWYKKSNVSLGIGTEIFTDVSLQVPVNYNIYISVDGSWYQIGYNGTKWCIIDLGTCGSTGGGGKPTPTGTYFDYHGFASTKEMALDNATNNTSNPTRIYRYDSGDGKWYTGQNGTGSVIEEGYYVAVDYNGSPNGLLQASWGDEIYFGPYY